MGRYDDIHPSDIDPETMAPYANYSSPSLDTSFHDYEMDVEGDEPENLRASLIAARAALAAANPKSKHLDHIDALLRQKGCEALDEAAEDGLLTTLCEIVIYG